MWGNRAPQLRLRLGRRRVQRVRREQLAHSRQRHLGQSQRPGDRNGRARTPCNNNSFTRNINYGATTEDRTIGMVLRCASNTLIANNTFHDTQYCVFDISHFRRLGRFNEGLQHRQQRYLSRKWQGLRHRDRSAAGLGRDRPQPRVQQRYRVLGNRGRPGWYPQHVARSRPGLVLSAMACRLIRGSSTRPATITASGLIHQPSTAPGTCQASPTDGAGAGPDRGALERN